MLAIEPEPRNLECLRRNFSKEIAQGRVVLVSKGVWSSEKTLTLFWGHENSGMASVLNDQGEGKVEIPVTTLDRIVQELGLSRVDYIKMDIEGAEREALKGASHTIARDNPTLMIESYHRPDDGEVLPALIRSVNPRYDMHCGPCERAEDTGALTPHVVYYR